MAQMLQEIVLGPTLLRFDARKFRGVMANVNQANFHLLKDLLEAGKIAPAIDRTTANIRAVSRLTERSFSDSAQPLLNPFPLPRPRKGINPGESTRTGMR